MWNFRKENQWQYNAGHTSCIWVEDKKQLSLQLWFKTYKNNSKKDRCDLLRDFTHPYAPQFSACIERNCKVYTISKITFKSLGHHLNTVQPFLGLEKSKDDIRSLVHYGVTRCSVFMISPSNIVNKKSLLKQHNLTALGWLVEYIKHEYARL